MEGVNDDDVALNPWPHHSFSRRRFTVSHSPPIVVNPYCSCVTRSRSSRANLRWLWGCKCGEELTAKVMWRWARPSPQDANRNAINLSYGDTAVVFHSQFSHGTAILRGNKAMKEGIHFWEVKMISPVYGTDLMLGIGTPELDLNMYRESFRSALGLDERSWGLSFRGKIQHKGEWRHYAPEFGQGSIVGVLLDLWHGTLTFYLNKRPLNVAFSGLTPSKTGYYAMVSSTAARTGVRLIRAESHSVSLQYLSLLKIRRSHHDPASILNLVTMPPGLQTFINNNLSYLIYPSPADMLPQQRSQIYGTQQVPRPVAPALEEENEEASSNSEAAQPLPSTALDLTKGYEDEAEDDDEEEADEDGRRAREEPEASSCHANGDHDSSSMESSTKDTDAKTTSTEPSSSNSESTASLQTCPSKDGGDEKVKNEISMLYDDLPVMSVEMSSRARGKRTLNCSTDSSGPSDDSKEELSPVKRVRTDVGF